MIDPAATDQIGKAGAAIAENGRVLATLDDWRAMGFIIVILFIVLVGIIVALLRANRQERTDMVAERERIWTVADKFGTAASQLTGELQVTQSLNARVEGALGRTEALLVKQERRYDRKP